MDEEFASDEEYVELLYHPKPWNSLSGELQSWFGVCNITTTSSSLIVSTPCCNEWPNNLNQVPTSREVCKCKGGKWGPTVNQNFDNIVNAVFTQFELSTTEVSNLIHPIFF